MERRGRIAVAFVLMAFAMIFLTGCTTEKHTEAAKETQQQTEHDAEKSGYEVSGDSPGQEPQQNPKDKDEAEETNQEITEENLYRPLMEAAIEAIEANDAEALHELQDSEDAKILTASVRDGEHYIYYPDGGQSGKGVGFYTFKECSCKQWYYGDYKDGKRHGKGIWYYVSSNTEDGSLYQELYDGGWKEDVPNGKGRQLIALGDHIDTDKKFKVKNGMFYGTYKIKDKLEDGTVVRGEYKLKRGKYVTISDEELEANNFEVPQDPHLAIAFLYNKEGVVKSCSMVYAEDITKGVKHFYPAE
ncbi:MAG: hypothetical protein HFH37_00125 [Lachnospiraceae bacterium]|nr:hypothetical protein [Lachnospiraceae bacterium]